MIRAAPSAKEIAGLAAEINRHACQGFSVCLPSEAIDQLYTAVPGRPGEGLRMLNDALHPAMKMHTIEDQGDMLFWIATRG